MALICESKGPPIAAGAAAPPRVRYFFYIPKIGYFEVEPFHPLFVRRFVAFLLQSSLHFLRGKTMLRCYNFRS